MLSTKTSSFPSFSPPQFFHFQKDPFFLYRQLSTPPDLSPYFPVKLLSLSPQAQLPYMQSPFDNSSYRVHISPLFFPPPSSRCFFLIPSFQMVAGYGFSFFLIRDGSPCSDKGSPRRPPCILKAIFFTFSLHRCSLSKGT